MPSYLELVLDTTNPTIGIFAPNETTTETNTLYRIESNEKLANIQRFYFIDSKGVRHDLHLGYYQTYFEGNVNFSTFSEGIATLHATVLDAAWNPSPLVKHSINVIETRTPQEIEEDYKDIEDSRAVVIDYIIKKIDTKLSVKKIEATVIPMKNLSTFEPRNEMEVEVEETIVTE
jgi:hypothetical protein